MPWVQLGETSKDRVYFRTYKEARRVAREALMHAYSVGNFRLYENNGVKIYKKANSRNAYDGVRYDGRYGGRIVAWHYDPKGYGVGKFVLLADGTVEW